MQRVITIGGLHARRLGDLSDDLSDVESDLGVDDTGSDEDDDTEDDTGSDDDDGTEDDAFTSTDDDTSDDTSDDDAFTSTDDDTSDDDVGSTGASFTNTITSHLPTALAAPANTLTAPALTWKQVGIYAAVALTAAALVTYLATD